MQLDIFADSHDVMLRNDVLDALDRRCAVDARLAWQRLVDEYPDDDSQAALAMLIDELDLVGASPFVDHGALETARRRLEEQVEPAARQSFGDAAGRAWIASCWRTLAQRAGALPYRADASSNHAAPLWLRAGDWAAGREAIERIESWRRIPAPLGWMAEVRYRAEGLEAAWPLLAELAWVSHARFARLLAHLADGPLDALHRKFDANFDGAGDDTDLAWFPAWVLTEKASLATLLRTAQSSLQTAPERGMRLLLQILSLEREGRQHELVEPRKTLRDLHAGLYAAYMKAR
jgi:hypothetical protein